jgi:hypothetical protein
LEPGQQFNGGKQTPRTPESAAKDRLVLSTLGSYARYNDKLTASDVEKAIQLLIKSPDWGYESHTLAPSKGTEPLGRGKATMNVETVISKTKDRQALEYVINKTLIEEFNAE